MPADSERPVAPPDVSGAALGCWTCDTISRIASGDPRFRLRVLTFFAEHGEGHRPWIDLTGQVPDAADPADRGQPGPAGWVGLIVRSIDLVRRRSSN